SQSAHQGQDIIQHILQRKGSGQRIEPSVRTLMETRIGEDFGGVRVHTDVHAAQTAEQLNAVAYTVGRDIFFSNGQYRPQTTEGKRLLAHELTHVVQQRFSTFSGQRKSLIHIPNDEYDLEARRIAGNVLGSTNVNHPVLRTPPAVQRMAIGNDGN